MVHHPLFGVMEQEEPFYVSQYPRWVWPNGARTTIPDGPPPSVWPMEQEPFYESIDGPPPSVWPNGPDMEQEPFYESISPMVHHPLFGLMEQEPFYVGGPSPMVTPEWPNGARTIYVSNIPDGPPPSVWPNGARTILCVNSPMAMEQEHSM